jgi:hypothetical protein
MHTPLILALRRLRWEDNEFKASLAYISDYVFKEKKTENKQIQNV